MLLYILLSFTALVSSVSSESCYYQRCLGCRPEEATLTGTSVECHPTNWVTAQWVHNLGHPPPSTNSIISIEYRCLKMVATPDDKTFGNTIDTIKGCVPKAQVDSVCLALEAIERARGHSDARCFICNGNNCNTGVHTQPLSYTVLLAYVLMIFYFVLR